MNELEFSYSLFATVMDSKDFMWNDRLALREKSFLSGDKKLMRIECRSFENVYVTDLDTYIEKGTKFVEIITTDVPMQFVGPYVQRYRIIVAEPALT